MKILHLTVDYPPPVKGGLDRQVQGLCHALARHHAITVVCGGTSRMEAGVRIHGVGEAVERLPERELSSLARANLAIGIGATRWLAGGTWDVVHVHDWMLAPAAVMLRDQGSIPIVAQFHADAGAVDVGTDEARARRLEWERALVRSADLVVACGSQLTQAIAGRYPGAEVRHVPNGVSIPDPDGHAGARSGTRLLFVGRLVPYKGCQDAIRAMAALGEMWPDASLTIAGDGFFRPELEHLVTRLGLESRVQFLGWQDDDQLARLYRSCTALVVPSHEEAFGLVAVEAMAHGLPVIASDLPTFRGMIADGATGRLVPVGDVDGLRQVMGEMLAQGEMRQQISRAAYGMVRDHYGWARVVDALDEAYGGLEMRKAPHRARIGVLDGKEG